MNRLSHVQERGPVPAVATGLSSFSEGRQSRGPSSLSHSGASKPFQLSRLKIQFAFRLGIRYASHLSSVIDRIRTACFQSRLNRDLREGYAMG